MATKSILSTADRRESGTNHESSTLSNSGSPITPRLIAAFAREGSSERAERYLRQASDVRLKGDVLEVVAPSSFVADLISRRIGNELCRVASQTLLEGRKAELQFRIAEPVASLESQLEVRQPIESARSRVAPAPQPSPSRHRLTDYVVGVSNRLAHAAAVRIAEEENVASLSPLFIHSACGMGKTHLLHGITSRFQELHPGAKVRCVSAEAFTNEFITSLRAGAIEGFRRTHRRLALLCIDDVHFLANKEATQTELLHTLDAVGFDRARIVLASDEHPRDIRKLSSGLASRFMSGAVLRIEEPDSALRFDLATILSARKGLGLDESGARALASANWKSVRELEGLFMQLMAVSRLMPEFAASGRLDAASVRRALDISGTRSSSQPAFGASLRPRRPVPIAIIQSEIARRLRVEHSDMAGKGRHPRVVLARSIVVHLARRLTTLSFPEIARAMNRPNHSSVITAHNRLLMQLKDRVGLAAASAVGLIANAPNPDDPGRSRLLAEMKVEIGPDLAGLTLAELCESIEQEVIRLADSV
ncbi:MAG: ATP-binding protein [Phycisphaeraceae bacterium]|nr:ATP-binding protein [Phycisphaeraceae bacterium]